MAIIIEQLQQLGFSQYEAQAYITLLKASPLNGYELAKASGIPRPNIYPVLQKLEERGVELRIDNPEGADYLPVAPQELVSRFKQKYLGDRFDALVDPQTRTTFEDLHPLPARAPWLEIMRQSIIPKETISK